MFNRKKFTLFALFSFCLLINTVRAVVDASFTDICKSSSNEELIEMREQFCFFKKEVESGKEKYRYFTNGVVTEIYRKILLDRDKLFYTNSSSINDIYGLDFIDLETCTEDFINDIVSFQKNIEKNDPLVIEKVKKYLQNRIQEYIDYIDTKRQ